ncbi:Crp/Fnr family transcriptional regulator [Aquibium sp. A9E412]|uniref:Crp/Fnr family transcriptional regulator n=1 Tax=Aquibium sp. A9E412 TaxID=2976767 RepID=UPI0025AEF548|nr:Crp/Fnr family transcriptional regulator [Aquibium sp. A9E412]MDN2565398.1 Crp/Fnr family transcriptional regulator [Aquibium sp. A9E412]
MAPATNGHETAAVSCEHCPLRRNETFRSFREAELDFMRRFKQGELKVNRGASILMEGAQNPHFYTVLSGWAFRYKTLEDGRRQIVNFAMPGDLVGLQGSLLGAMQHSVEALSPMTLCVFDRNELFTLYQAHPELAYDVTWIASREECMLDENLLTIGRRSALERIAYLLAFIGSRSIASGLMKRSNAVTIGMTQQHVADTLGLSLVHTNKTLRKLVRRDLLRWGDGGCQVFDLKGLAELAGWEDTATEARPFL